MRSRTELRKLYRRCAACPVSIVVQRAAGGVVDDPVIGILCAARTGCDQQLCGAERHAGTQRGEHIIIKTQHILSRDEISDGVDVIHRKRGIEYKHIRAITAAQRIGATSTLRNGPVDGPFRKMSRTG